MFPLCPSCSDIQNKNECKCSDKDGVLHGTYCTPELIKAKEMEYKILRIYEVYHWSETAQYDPASKSGGLFSNYMNMFLKIKQQASGLPSDIDRDQYIHDVF